MWNLVCEAGRDFSVDLMEDHPVWFLLQAHQVRRMQKAPKAIATRDLPPVTRPGTSSQSRLRRQFDENRKPPKQGCELQAIEKRRVRLELAWTVRVLQSQPNGPKYRVHLSRPRSHFLQNGGLMFRFEVT